MLTDKMLDGLNEQINYELYSAYIYYSMSAYCQSLDLVGMASWFKVQALEELFHVSKFFDYICDRGSRVKLQEVKGPRVEWDSPLGAFSDALKHEQSVSKRIHDLVTLAQSEKDRSTESFLQWFVAEQVEEEATVSQIVGQLKIAGSEGPGLFFMDQQLGQRTYTPPAATGA
jgi:ferritin